VLAQTKELKLKKTQTKRNTSAKSSGNRSVLLTGDCRMNLDGIYDSFFPCKSKVSFSQLADGGSFLMFGSSDVIFTLFSENNPPPKKTSYSLSINTLRVNSGGNDIPNYNIKGECDFRKDEYATKFLSVRCEINDLANLKIYYFYLKNITETK
jgi:hypothetical protein